MQGNELRDIRKQMDMSQAALAHALDLSQPFIGMMERGEKPIERRTEFSVRYLAEHPEARPDDDEMQSMSAAEAIESALRSTGLTHGQEWGPWRFDAETMTLDFRYYQVALEEMTSASNVLDWIGQIAGKPWGAPAVGYFVQALDDIVPLQGNYVRGKRFETGDAVLGYIRDRISPPASPAPSAPRR